MIISALCVRPHRQKHIRLICRTGCIFRAAKQIAAMYKSKSERQSIQPSCSVFQQHDACKTFDSSRYFYAINVHDIRQTPVSRVTSLLVMYIVPCILLRNPKATTFESLLAVQVCGMSAPCSNNDNKVQVGIVHEEKNGRGDEFHFAKRYSHVSENRTVCRSELLC